MERAFLLFCMAFIAIGGLAVFIIGVRLFIAAWDKV
jgi:hypothetical protein